MSTNSGSKINPYSERQYTIENVKLAYPTYFQDGQSAMAVFTADSVLARDLIKASGFDIAEIWPGKTLLSIVSVHYTDSQCGKYDEIALAFMVKPRAGGWRIPYLSTWIDLIRGKLPSYTWCLPVTSVLAEQCGIQMWGFPKTIEELRYKHEDGRASFSWNREGKQVLTLSLPATGSRVSEAISPPVYSLMDGVPVVSYLTQRYSGVGYHRGGFKITLGSGDMADTLRALGLPKKPLLAVWYSHLDFEMSAPALLEG